jgi:dipeptidyl aminopeptidase/acylaminoacyl peptidase
MPTLDPQVLFQVPNVYNWGGGFDVSPDGRTVVFMWNISGQWELYLMPIDGPAPARPITSGPESKMFPRFSPDGTRVAYLQDYQGDENFDVYLIDLASGQVTNLMPDTPEGLNDWLRWSPDGQWIYYTSNREQNFASYAVRVDDGTIKRVSHHADSDILVEPSPDGRWLAVMAQADGQNIATYLVPTDGGDEVRLGSEQGLDDAASPDWSPDSRRLTFVSADKGQFDVGLYEVATRTIAWLTTSDHEYYAPVWSPQGDRLAYLAHRDGNFDIVLHDLTRGAEFLPVPAGLHNQVRFTPDGEALIFTYASAAYPADLWKTSLRERTARQLTESLPQDVDRSVFARPRHVWYPSLDPGVEVPALLYVPKDLPADRKPPAVLYIHGGPTAQHENDWYPAVEDLVLRGYVVICPNYRGSTGYGRKFREANRYDLGRGDTNDCAAAADYLIRAGLADPKRIGITGISYGGFMTMTCVTKYPDKWAAGSALVPFVNWFTEHANEREDLQYWDEQNMGDPVKDYDRWYANSPIFFIDQITAPIQLIAGGNDIRCPLSEAEQVRDKLIELGRSVEMHVYHDEGHILRQLDNRLDAYRRRADFFDRYLKIDYD